jgi:hemolysin activation/secretion protein
MMKNDRHRPVGPPGLSASKMLAARFSNVLPASRWQIRALQLCCVFFCASSPAQELTTPARTFVREFRFDGNTVFSDAELRKLTAPYTGRELSREELEEARRAVTLQYVEAGYINSGAVLPEQPVTDGVVTIRIVEGVLSGINVQANRWLRDSYIEARLNRWAGRPLNVNRLREGLQLLRQNPNVQQVNAELKPGALPGESYLDVRVVDRHPFRVALQVDNARPPSVGAEQILLLAADYNLTGHSDALEFSYGIANARDDGFKFSDFDNVAGSYTVPVTRYDTTLRIYGSKNDYAVIEEPFAVLNISSESYRAGASLRQPVYRTANRELALGVVFERRRSKTFLLGEAFSITPGAVNGTTEISALRFFQEWIDRGPNQVLGLRSTFSVGIDVFGVTDDGTDRDAKFWAWLGQAQYVRRLFNTANQLIVRADVQWTDDPLLSLEQFPVGGAYSVRGYRENQLVRDRGVLGSVELRLPVVANKAGSPVVQLAPFFDFGAGWNVDSSPKPRTLTSAGIGLLLTPHRRVNAQLYWGHAFRDVKTANNDPQDAGFHFRVTVEAL